MLALIISITGAIFIWIAFFTLLSSPWLGLLVSFIFLAAFHILINLSLRKRIESIFMESQNNMMALQNKIMHKATILQQNGCSDIKKLQELQETELRSSLPQIIASYDRLKPYYKWSILTERQVNTVKAQLYFQMKDYNNAQLLLKKALTLDPMLVAMKVVVLYKKKEIVNALKIASKNAKRFKGDKAVILYALWSWILVQLKKNDEALKVLVEGKERTGNNILKTNWEHLANNRIEKYSNAALGDSWYALNLELPKVSRQKAPNYMRQKRH